MVRSPPEGVSVGPKDDNLFVWEVMIVGPTGTSLEGGFFKAELRFPDDFPNSPPEMKFITPMWHPNIYPDGKVCISILHSAGVDRFNTLESADERWRPILGVEQILVSVIAMLNEPNISSPANVDAAVQFRDDPKGYRRKVREIVAKTME